MTVLESCIGERHKGSFSKGKAFLYINHILHVVYECIQ